jgi:5-enolpyruvylshikimate-3-phosphate synthase
MTPEEGEAQWPSLRLHESDRIIEMEEALAQDTVTSADHRVVQAVAMRKGNAVSFSRPEAVAKSWPQFWQFLNAQRT